MPISKKWLEYPSIKKVIRYLAGKNGGYKYVKEVSLLTGYVEPVYYFAKFCGYGDPESLLQDIQKGKVKVEDVILEWRSHLLENRRAPSTMHRYHNGVKRWLIVNRVKVDWEELESIIPLPKIHSVVTDRSPRIEELQKIMTNANLRAKAIIELAVSTGIRATALTKLHIDDLNFDRDPKVLIIKVRPENSKTNIGYYTLATDEARAILKEYIETYEIEGWLFPQRSNKNNPMTYHALQQIWIRLLKKTGLDEKDGSMHILHFHTLRKFFRTRLEGYMTSSEIHYLMGHLKKEYLDGSYYRPPSDELIEKYKNAMHRLYILWRPEPQETNIRKKLLIDMARLLGLEEEKIAKLENLLKHKDIETAIKEFRGLEEYPE